MAATDLFTHLAPVLNVADIAAERAFYERLGVPVIYEGDEYPDFIAFGTDHIQFGIQVGTPVDPASVLTWQIGVSSIDEAMSMCERAGLAYEVEQEDPAPGWRYRRLLLLTPNGYRLALEGSREPGADDEADPRNAATDR